MTDNTNIIKEALEESIQDYEVGAAMLNKAGIAHPSGARIAKAKAALALIENGEVMSGQKVSTFSGIKTKITWSGGSFPVLVIPLEEQSE